MNRTLKLLSVLIVAALCISHAVYAGGRRDASLTRVNIGVHANGGGSSAVAIAIERGYFREFGIDPIVTVVESGPVQMAAMRADSPTLDIGYIGAGVAWNAIDSTGNCISFVFLDGLSNSERVVARTGFFVPNAAGRIDYASLYNGFRGRTVHLEKGTTSGVWFKHILELINANFPPADRLWIQSDNAAFLADYTPANNNPANRVTVINFLNSNIPAGMATAGADAIDIAVAFAPVPTILASIPGVEEVADASSLPGTRVLPTTWVARTNWLQSNPELARNFIFALYRAVLFRAANLDESMRAAERLTGRPTGTFDHGGWFFPAAANYREWFADNDSVGFGFLRTLYDVSVPNIPAGATPKPFEQAFDLENMLLAIREFQ